MFYLFELVLSLDGLEPLLLDVPIRGLPHEEVFDDVLHGLPRQVVPLDVVELFAVLLHRLLEQVGLGGGPVLHLVAAKKEVISRHEINRKNNFLPIDSFKS